MEKVYATKEMDVGQIDKWRKWKKCCNSVDYIKKSMEGTTRKSNPPKAPGAYYGYYIERVTVE